MAASIDNDDAAGIPIPESDASSRSGRILEPLTFDVGSLGSTSSTSPNFAVGTPPILSGSDDSLMKCIFCDEHFNGKVQFRDDYLRHLLQQHKFVIGDFKTVPDFRRYIEYWRMRFRGRPKTDFCSVIRTNTGENDIEPSEDYYLLCDALPEDKDVRNKLQIQKLREVLEQQQRERNSTTFDFGCLFCKDHFNKNRAELLNHMAKDHNFNIGHPDNLVYTDELLTLLHQKVDGLICFYCEKKFKDRFVLKEHMRKKQHKQINPRDKNYDRFYVINYLEIGKTWEDIQSQDDGEMRQQSDSGSDWEDWLEDEESAVCLYCTVAGASHHVIAHMRDVHEFDLRKIKSDLKLTFYQQVKLVNYIRRQIYQNTCPLCESKHESREKLRDHMNESGHITTVPLSDLWDQPEFYFPTYENDRLLYCLEEETDASDDKEKGATASVIESIEEVTDAVVIAEDMNIEEAMNRRDYIMKELRS